SITWSQAIRRLSASSGSGTSYSGRVSTPTQHCSGNFSASRARPGIDDRPLPEAVANGVRRAHGGRTPGEARPALERIRDAAVPSLVASGDHSPGIERICDALAVALDAQRLVAPGAGHFVAAAPGFTERFERFLLAKGGPV